MCMQALQQNDAIWRRILFDPYRGPSFALVRNTTLTWSGDGSAGNFLQFKNCINVTK